MMMMMKMKRSMRNDLSWLVSIDLPPFLVSWCQRGRRYLLGYGDLHGKGPCICIYHSFGFAPCRIWYLNYLVWWCVCVEQVTSCPYYETMCFIFVMCKCGWLTLQQIMSLPRNDHLLIGWSSYCQMPIWSNGILSHNMVWYDIQTLSSSPCHKYTQWMILCKYNFCSCLE